VKKLMVQDTPVSLARVNDNDYISLTDIARVRNPDEPKDVVKNWLRNRATVEYLGLWEKINNAAFKGVEFDSFKLQAGSNSFTLSPNKWITTALVVLSNLESLTAAFMRQGLLQPQRLKSLNELAIGQLRSLLGLNTKGKLK
jgi:hypothetical protein